MAHDPAGLAALALVDSLLVELGKMGTIIPKDRQSIIDRAIKALGGSTDADKKAAGFVLIQMYGGPQRAG